MMTAPSNRSGKNRNSAINGLAGAGTGTLLLSLAQNLPDEYTWKKWLIIIAPSVSIISSNFFSWLQSYISEKNKEKKFKRICDGAKKRLLDEMENPNTPENKKEEYQEKLKEIILLEHNADISRIKTLSNSF